MTGLYRDQVIPPGDDDEADPYAPGRPSLIREYLGTEPRRLLYSVGFILGVMVVVTVPYVWLVGLDKWTSDMKEAGHMLWAGYTPAAAGAPVGAPPGYAYPYAAGPAAPAAPYGYGYAVVPAALPSPAPPAATAPALLRPGLGRQYVCPSCGAVGMPSWTPAGQPQCPACGGLMAVAPLRWEAELGGP
ncbi:MAG TPA: hypothetical protein VGQ83_37540 [Polyangia bacterium]|jgi:hypothetical protein